MRTAAGSREAVRRWSAVSAPALAGSEAALERLRSKLAASRTALTCGACAKVGDDGAERGARRVTGVIEIMTIAVFSSSRDKNKYFIAVVKNKIQMTWH